jgi:predicted dehydrogenase/threonine dehydrogenase-like Zn-dependent dehydrogenase
MKQVIQNLRTGVTGAADVPCPKPKAGELLIATHASLISAGTEKMLVEFGRASLLEKVRQRSDKLPLVIDKIRTDGLLPAIAAVKSRLDQPMPLGYCNAGTVIEVGAGVAGFVPGDRVASNGKHAEAVTVPVNLCARIPAGVGDDEAAFAPIAAIALQGIRLAAPTLGEAFVVTGLGLVGLITVQLLRANGCRVLGIDYDERKLALAQSYGAQTVDLSRGEDALGACSAFTQGRGADGVVIAAATSSNEPVHQAAQMSRKRGRIVLVGVSGLELSRADFYEKELSFQVSCSYGPGRYDPSYEERGNDYPLGFVRWTEQRNFEAVLDLLAQGKLDVKPLISHRFGVERAEEAYTLLSGPAPYLGIILEYPRVNSLQDIASTAIPLPRPAAASRGAPVIGVVGAGDYGSRVLIPAFRESRARLKTIVTSGGVSGTHVGSRNGFELASTDWEALLSDPEIDALVVATRHDTHARIARAAILAGKHVFVEKPLGIRVEEIDAVQSAARERGNDVHQPILMVGFNRRFAPLVVRMKELLESVREAKSFIMTVNAGAVPPGHWTRDPDSGGGRIVGEACHFIDLLRFLAGSAVVEHQVAAARTRDACVTLTLRFSDGSTGALHYLSNGHRSFPKERLEVFCGGRILQLDNFRALRGFGWPGFKAMKLWRQDKGQTACVDAFVTAVREGKPSPIPLSELIEVAKVTLAVAAAANA